MITPRFLVEVLVHCALYHAPPSPRLKYSWILLDLSHRSFGPQISTSPHVPLPSTDAKFNPPLTIPIIILRQLSTPFTSWICSTFADTSSALLRFSVWTRKRDGFLGCLCEPTEGKVEPGADQSGAKANKKRGRRQRRGRAFVHETSRCSR